MLLSYIANPQLELVLVMLIVPFIVNVSRDLVKLIQCFHLDSISDTALPLSLPVVHHVLGGGQPDDEEVQDDEEPGGLLRRLGKEGRHAALDEQRGIAGENDMMIFVPTDQGTASSGEQLLLFFSHL